MIAITVSRRPLSEGSVAANVLTHGTGAINIDASRLSTGDNLNGGAYAQSGSERHDGAENWRYKRGEQGNAGEFTPPIGRWPANLILQHLPGCQESGSAQVGSGRFVPSDGVTRTSTMMSSTKGWNANSLSNSKKNAPNSYGTETVTVWDCQPGCIIPNLNAQSGISKSSGGRAYQNTNDMYSGGWAHKGTGVQADPGFGDIGGASRYFKQIGGHVADVPSDLIEYLTTLITPTHIGGESLIALDIDSVDWATIADGQYHGLIARGEPTPEQTEHMWRVVKPGAHVLLIAPDSCPTGHHGACALEDQGFEIRDAILWVREAGKMHYVPKPNSRERNAGCEHLAAKRKGAPVYELTEEAMADEDALTELTDALTAAGVDADVIDAVQENGLPKDQIPKGFRHLFQKREGNSTYGNSHPTVKAKDIMKRLLSDVPQDHVVLDPFMGSGTTALACLDTGHSFIGIEREAEYIEIADARVRYWNTAEQAWNAVPIESEAPKSDDKPAEVHGGLFDMFGED